MYTQQQKTKRIVVLGMLTAISVILYFVEIPFFSGPLKLDFSDLPAAIAAVLFGPVAGIVIELLKNAINLFIKDWAQNMGFGALLNVIVGIALVVPLSAVTRGMVKRAKSWMPSALLGGLAGLIVMVAIGALSNYLIDPAYMRLVYHIPNAQIPAMMAVFISWATLLNVVKAVLTTILLVFVMAAMRKNEKVLRV